MERYKQPRKPELIADAESAAGHWILRFSRGVGTPFIRFSIGMFGHVSPQAIPE
jgi:hypothetical protein